MSRVIDAARAMGLDDPLPRRPALLLGAADVRPIDLIAAYAPLARGDGRAVRPRFVTRVESAEGETVLVQETVTQEGVPPEVAAALRGMLTQVIERGTAQNVRRRGLTGPVAGKTGTTNGTTNAWFVG